MATKQAEVDVLVENYGSIMLCRPLTQAAKDWVSEHVDLEGWQWHGGGFAVELGFLENLLDGMSADGLVIA